MASAVIGSLRVNLSASTAEFSRGLKAADGQAQRWSASMKKAFAAVAAGVAVLGVALARAVGTMTAELDAMSKASQRFGVPIETLSALKHAADLSGVSFETLGTSVQRLSRAMADSFRGASNAGTKALADLGVSVTDANGQMRDTTDVLADLADRFASMPDGAMKTAAAVELFGRAGSDLIPMLNQGKAGLQDMLAEAQRLGIVMSTEAAQAAERFRDNLSRLDAGMRQGFLLGLTEGLLPALDDLVANFTDSTLAATSMREAGERLGEALGEATKAVAFLAENSARLTSAIFPAVVGIRLLTSGVRSLLGLVPQSWADQMAEALAVVGINMGALRDGTAGADASLALLGKNVINTSIPSIQSLGAEIAAAGEGMAAMPPVIDDEVIPAFEALKIKNEELAAAIENTWRDAGASIAGSLAEIGRTFGKES